MDGIIGGCFPWSWFVDSVLWKHLCPKGLFFRKQRALDTTTIFPNKLVLEILSRLPLSSGIRFRLVCKQWCLLTLTPSFIKMHENNQPTPLESAFVVQYSDHLRAIPRFLFKTFFFNEKATKRNKKFEMVREYIDLTQARDPRNYYIVDLISSYKGFLLFSAKYPWSDKDVEESALIFYNPVTKEQVTVTSPPSTYVYCGFFFHSPTKEYRILYQVFDDDHTDVVDRFELLGLQTRSLRKIYVNKKFSAKYHPDPSRPAVISNGVLHWMVSEAHHQKVFDGAVPSCSETILTFGIESEEFCLMPHPRFCSGRHDCVSLQRRGGHKMNLLEMEGGILCLCDGYSTLQLNLYVMENYKKWTWQVRRYVIPLHAYYGFIRTVKYGLHVKALHIHRGELLLHYHPDSFTNEYLFYPLNQGEPFGFLKWFFSSGSKNFAEQFKCFNDDSLYLRKKQKKKNKVVIERLILKKNDLMDDDQTLRRMIINHPGSSRGDSYQLVPSASVGNMVVITPSLGSLRHHSGKGNGGGKYFLSVQHENHKSTLSEYDVQTGQWRRVLVVGSSSSTTSSQ